MKARHKVILDNCLDTVRAISASPQVDQYLIGFTRMDSRKKYGAYKREGFQHLVLLADRLDRREALELEGSLQRSILASGKGILLEKYHAEKKARGVTYRSSGGSVAPADVKECSVYMAWFEPVATKKNLAAS